MATASSSGKAMWDDQCRNTRAGDSSECTAAMANTGPPDEENHESERFCAAPSASFYHSTRIQRMIDAGSHQQSETTESSTVQAEIEASKVTWSDLDNATMSQTKHLAEANQKYFEFLKRRNYGSGHKYFWFLKHYGRKADQIIAMDLTEDDKPQSVPSSFHNWWAFLTHGKYVRKRDQIVAKERTQKKKLVTPLFRDYDTLIVGEKLAEGGQAEIYAASVDPRERTMYSSEYETAMYNWEHKTASRVPMVVKVFKAGSLLSDLQKQWHPALLKYYERKSRERVGLPCIVEGATLLRDERLLHRFAFVMPRLWGDLRKLIDHQMIHESHNRGPPFSLTQISYFMWILAVQMFVLHALHPPILHKDLKAANVLVVGLKMNTMHLADYECSVGVVGTGFWRAPEILLQLKNRDPDSPLDLKFTDKCDVYSYGMLCYEIVTGRIPFEDCPFDETRELVLNGVRPELPMDLVASVKDIIVSCWHAIPSRRPSFQDIKEKIFEAHLSKG